VLRFGGPAHQRNRVTSPGSCPAQLACLGSRNEENTARTRELAVIDVRAPVRGK
jgi:hypothetical protein